MLADTFWRMPGVRRSDHPFAIAALGPLFLHAPSEGCEECDAARASVGR